MPTRTTATATALAIVAIAAPSAAARPIEDYVPNSVNDGGEDQGLVSSSNGFDWADAGIGAGGILSVLGLAGGLTLAGRRARRREHAVG